MLCHLIWEHRFSQNVWILRGLNYHCFAKKGGHKQYLENSYSCVQSSATHCCPRKLLFCCLYLFFSHEDNVRNINRTLWSKITRCENSYNHVPTELAKPTGDVFFKKKRGELGMLHPLKAGFNRKKGRLHLYGNSQESRRKWLKGVKKERQHEPIYMEPSSYHKVTTCKLH